MIESKQPQKQDQILQSSLKNNYSESDNSVSVNLANGINNPNDEQIN